MNVGIGQHQILGKIATGRLPCPLPDISEHRSDETWDVGLLSGYRQFAVRPLFGQPAFRGKAQGRQDRTTRPEAHRRPPTAAVLGRIQQRASTPRCSTTAVRSPDPTDHEAQQRCLPRRSRRPAPSRLPHSTHPPLPTSFHCQPNGGWNAQFHRQKLGQPRHGDGKPRRVGADEMANRASVRGARRPRS